MKRSIYAVFLILTVILALSCSRKDKPDDKNTLPTAIVTPEEGISENTISDTDTTQITETDTTIAASSDTDSQTTEGQLNAYRFTCRDTEGTPVKGVRIQICTDETCIMLTSDENGEVIFDGESMAYSVHIYSFPADYYLSSEDDFETEAEYCEYTVDFISSALLSAPESADQKSQ